MARKSDRERIASRLDHTLLRADATERDIRRLCREAMGQGFHSVCVAPVFVGLARRILQDSSVRVCTVIDFPLGASSPRNRIFQSMEAAEQGADELDIVISLSAALEGRWSHVVRDLHEIALATPSLVHKAILETSLLSQGRKRHAACAAMEAGMDFVKTSTGFSTGGATLEEVRFLRSVVGNRCGIKASGGVRDAATCLALLEAGADRIGTSSGVAIMKSLETLDS